MSRQEILRRLEQIDHDASEENEPSAIRWDIRSLIRSLERELWWEEVKPGGAEAAR